MNVLTTMSQIQCMHGALAQVLAPTQTAASATEGVVLVESDTHTVITPCPFMRGSDPSPCVLIEWSAGAGRVTASGDAVLTQSSIGTCRAADGSSQGAAIIGQTQTRASAT
jgi:hypothetical protein